MIPKSRQMFLTVGYGGEVTNRNYAGTAAEEVFPAFCF